MLPSTSLPPHDISSALSRLLQRRQALPKTDIMEILFPPDSISIATYFAQVSGLLGFEPFRARLMKTLVKRVFLAKAFNASEHEYLVFELEGDERRMQVERTTGSQSLKKSEKLAKLILVPIPKSLRKKKSSKHPSSEKSASASQPLGSPAVDSETPSESEESSDPSLSLASDSPTKSSSPSPSSSPASSNSSGSSRFSLWRKIPKILRSTASLASSSSASSSSSTESTDSSSRRLFTGFRSSRPFKRRCASAPATFNNDKTLVADESSASSSSDVAVPSQVSSLSGYTAPESADHLQTTLSADGTCDESENAPASDPARESGIPLFPEHRVQSDLSTLEYLVPEEVDEQGSLGPMTSLSGSTKLASVSSSEDATRVDPEPSSESSLSSSSESKRSLKSITRTAMKFLRTSLLLTGIVSLASMVDTLASDRIIAYIPKEEDKTLEECTVQCMEFEDGHSPPLWKVILACMAAHQLDPFYKLWLHQCYWYAACICYLLQYMVGEGNYRVFDGPVASEGDSDNFSFTTEEKTSPKTHRLPGHWGFVPVYDQKQREFTQLEESFNKFVLQFEDSVNKAEEENRRTLEEERQAAREEILEKTTQQLAKADAQTEQALKRADQEYEERRKAEEKADEERRKAESKELELEEERRRTEEERRRAEEERRRTGEERRRAEEERRRTEEERRRAEEERQKAETRELELEEERRKADEERRKAHAKELELEEERRRTDEERRRAEEERRRAEGEHRRAEEERNKSQEKDRQLEAERLRALALQKELEALRRSINAAQIEVQK